MDIVQTGIVLKTENYEDCRDFYRDTLCLPIIFVEDHDTWNITCFEIGASYLMIETGGVASPPEKSFAQSPIKIRLNVSDIESTVRELQTRGVATVILRHDWGEVAEFCDPDGNRVAVRKHSTVYSRGEG